MVALGKLSLLATLTAMVRLTAEGLKDPTLEELWAGSSAWLGLNIHAKASRRETGLQGAFMGWQRAMSSVRMM